ncbi:MAG: inorganic phosphate transporter [Planctomycetes bacterium]|nr:inorganic phosphate transporter [Planctomycetota bacterium]
MEPTTLIVAVVIAALIFDFCNGWNDSANAIATVVSTRVLSPITAVVLAALLNFAGAFASEEVAKTIGSGLVNAADVTQTIVLASMLSASVWVAMMTFVGMPISGSHSLIGALVGAAAFAKGWSIVHSGGVFKVLVAMLISPILGALMGFVIMAAVLWLFRRARPTFVNQLFGKLQLLSVSLMSWMHGTNDAQKVMGVITLALFAGGFVETNDVPLWVKVSCATMMGLGTACGGWKVIRTLGMGLIKIRPVHGFAAETGASLTLGLAAWQGIPVSTTHTITGSIIGVGTTQRASVSWGLGKKILYAWLLTLPSTALLGGLFHAALVSVGLGH